MNRIRHNDTVEIPVAKSEQKMLDNTRFLKAFNIFGFADRTLAIRLVPFFFFMAGIALLYIANSYVAERTIRDIDRTEKELKELRSEFITTKSELMYRSKLSEVAQRISPLGIKESTQAPGKVVQHLTPESKK